MSLWGRAARVGVLSFLLTALVLVSGTSKADPIGPTCTNNSCFGGIYQLVYQQVSATHYLFGIVMDLSNNTLAAGTTIENVAFKVTSSTSDILSAVFLGTNAAGTWSQPIIGGLNNSGCSAGNQAFLCSSHSGAGQLADTNTILGWVFDVTVNNASDWKLLTASLKIDFSGNGHLLSEPITAQPGTPTVDPRCIPVESCTTVPEPAPLALIAAGLCALVFARRRKPKVEKFDWDSWMP